MKSMSLRSAISASAGRFSKKGTNASRAVMPVPLARLRPRSNSTTWHRRSRSGHDRHAGVELVVELRGEPVQLVAPSGDEPETESGVRQLPRELCTCALRAAADERELAVR